MKLKRNCMFFNANTPEVGGTPDWEHTLGQGQPSYLLKEYGCSDILNGLTYNLKDPNGFNYGNGGANYDIQIVSIFEKINIKIYDVELKAESIHSINKPLIVILTKQNNGTHIGRRLLKFSNGFSYKHVKNSDFYDAINNIVINPWFSYEITYDNMDTGILTLTIIKAPLTFPDPANKQTRYATKRQRKDIWQNYANEYASRSDGAQDNNDPRDKYILKKNIQTIYYGAPGTGKSYEIRAITASQAHIRTTFHPDSDYSTFVGAYKPTMTKVELRDVTGKVIVEHGEKVTEDKIVYSYVPQSFLQSYTSAWENYPTNQFLIIEEINRGNCAQIFGDLFQLLDRSKNGFSDYPIQADNDIKNYIANYFIENNVADKISENKERINAIYADEYSNAFERILSGELLVLPSNLSILATMNTSDQSLFPIDSAFKRRWDWVYKPISDAKKGRFITANGVDYDWWSFVEKINEKIFDTTNSEDKKLGYFFVIADDKGEITAERFVGKVIFYLWNDVFKDYGFDDDIFLDNEENKVLAFQKFYNIDGKVNESILEKFLNNLEVNECDDLGTTIGSSESN